jgi:hypothetical protein
MPNVEIFVNKDFEGPSILELTDIIDGIDEAIKVDWSNTRDEISTILRFPDKNFVLYVRDFSMRDRTASTLGLFLKLEEQVVEKAKTLLIQPKEYDWRNFCRQNEHGPSTRNILLKITADAIRKGLRPALAEIVASVFHDGISIVDVDVLLRLKGKQR